MGATARAVAREKRNGGGDERDLVVFGVGEREGGEEFSFSSSSLSFLLPPLVRSRASA